MSTSESDNPLSDYMDKQIKEAATRIESDYRVVDKRISINVPYKMFVKAGFGLTFGALAAVCLVAMTAEIIKHVWLAIKQLLGF